MRTEHIPKKVRKLIKNTKMTMAKSTIFPKEKQHKLAKDTAESMKKHYKMKAAKHSKEDLKAAGKHMMEHKR